MVFGWTARMMRSSRSVLLLPPARWTARRCWSGCECTVFDPLLTQNPKKAGRAGRKQRKIRRANGGKKHKSEPKCLRFALETTCGPEGRGFESLTACHPETVAPQRLRGFLWLRKPPALPVEAPRKSFSFKHRAKRATSRRLDKRLATSRT